MPKPLCFMIMPYGTKADPGRTVLPAWRNRLQRALGSRLRADHQGAWLRAGPRRSGHWRADHHSDDRAALFRRSRARRHDDPERQCLLRGRRPPRGQGDRAASCSPPTGRSRFSTSRRCGPFAIRCRRETSPRRPQRRSRRRSRGRSKSWRAAFRRSSSRSRDIRHNVDPAAASTMKDAMVGPCRISGRRSGPCAHFPGRPHGDVRKQLVGKYLDAAGAPRDAIALIACSEDSADDQRRLELGSTISSTNFLGIADLEEVREPMRFALSNAGKPIDAIAKLEELIARSGPTPERLGLLGGRYKRLFAKAATRGEADPPQQEHRRL